MSEVRRAWWPLLVSRLGLVAVVALLVYLLPPAGLTWNAFPESPWLDAWVRLDAGWHWSLADQGYRQEASAFLPLFSALTALLSLPWGLVWPEAQAFFVTALLVNLAAGLAAALGLVRLATGQVGATAAGRCAWLWALFPFAFYQLAAYPDSLAMACLVWAFVWWGEGRRWQASLGASLALLTSPIGWLGSLALILDAGLPGGVCRTGPDPAGQTSTRVGPWLWLYPIGLAGLGLGLLGLSRVGRMGAALDWFWVRWGFAGGQLWDLMQSADPPLQLLLAGCLLGLLGTALTLPYMRSLPRSWRLLVALTVVTGATSSLLAFVHWMAALFPLFVLAGARLRGVALALTLTLEAGWLIFYAYLFASGVGPG